MLRKVIIVVLFLCIFSFLCYGCVTRPTIKEDTVREKVPAPDTIVNGWDMSTDELQQFISHEYFSKVDLKKELDL